MLWSLWASSFLSLKERASLLPSANLVLRAMEGIKQTLSKWCNRIVCAPASHLADLFEGEWCYLWAYAAPKNSVRKKWQANGLCLHHHSIEHKFTVACVCKLGAWTLTLWAAVLHLPPLWPFQQFFMINCRSFFPSPSLARLRETFVFMCWSLKFHRLGKSVIWKGSFLYVIRYSDFYKLVPL